MSPQQVPVFSGYDELKFPTLVLEEKQESSLQELKTIILKDLEEELQCSNARNFEDSDYLRYLRANKWNVKTASDAIKLTVNWRKEFNPQALLNEDYSIEGATGKIFVSGFDKENHPLLYMYPTRQNTSDSTMHIKITIVALETAIKILPPGVEKITVILDLRGYGLKHTTPMAESKEFLAILSSHYPERLAKAIILDAPWIFSSFFKLISPFIDPVTRQKIVFSSVSTKNEFHISNFISDKFLPKGLGGKNEFIYDCETYFGCSKKLFQDSKG